MSEIATALQEIRTDYLNRLDASETRMSEFGLIEGAKADTNSRKSVIDENVKAAFFTSYEREAGFKIPVFNKSTPTIGSAVSCTIPNPAITTALVAVTSTPYFWGWTIDKSLASNNLVTWQKIFERQYDDHMDVVAKTIETAIAAGLSTNKSQKENSSFTGVGAKYGDFETADTIAVSLALTPLFYNDIPSIMNANDYGQGRWGAYNIYGSTELAAHVNYIGNQGGGNSTNLSYQIPGFNHWYSNRIPAGSGNIASGYIVPEGQLGIMERLPYDFREGSETSDGMKFGMAIEPYTGFRIGTMYKSTCSNENTRHGETYTSQSAVVVDQFGFFLDIGLLFAYNSAPTTTPSPYFKFELSNT